MRHEYEIQGMHCQGCVGKVTAALRSLPGVSSAEVTLHPPRARVDMDQHIETKKLDETVSASGEYRIKEATPGVTTSSVDVGAERKESLFPLFLIVGYIAGTVGLIALASGEYSLHTGMRHFMAGFFLVFSFFKLLDLRGFADAYQSYDIVARRFRAWAFAYPFVELALGVAYVLDLYPVPVNVATLALMLLGSVGVLKSLLDKRAIRCACLGTALNLPMTKITLAEDLGMAAMAAVMLVTL
jgi:copper chaperone CopZ